MSPPPAHPAREELAAYAAGVLEPHAERAVEAHAATCPTCAQALDDELDLEAGLRAAMRAAAAREESAPVPFGGGAVAAAGGPGGVGAAAPPEHGRDEAPVRLASPPRPSRARRAAFAAVAVLALAAAALLAVRPEPAPVPAYRVSLGGENALTLSEPSPEARPVFNRESTIEVVLRPEVAAEVPAVHLFALSDAGVTPLDTSVEDAPSGAVRLRHRVDGALPQGEVTLVVAVGPAGTALPGEVRAGVETSAATLGGWRLYRLPLTVADGAR